MSGSLTVLSAFTGAGGMDLGLEAAGFSCVGCIESDLDPRGTIEKNREWRLLEPFDIAELSDLLDPRDLGLERGQLDLLAAGPPCQPFSTAAQWAKEGRKGLADRQRATALFALFDLVETFLPRAVILENVPGFVRGKGAALGWIQDRLTRMNSDRGDGYSLHITMVNAADYGVPQNRRRAIVVLLRDTDLFEWPSRTHVDRPITAWDALRNIDVINPPKPKGEWAELLPSIPEGWNYIWHTDRGGGLPLFGYRTRYWSFLLKLGKEKPSWTISAQSGPSSGPFHWKSRPLDTSEMAALQTFPSSWTFAGPERSIRRQIGNATPPLLAEIIGRAVATALNGQRAPGDLVHAVEPSSQSPSAEAIAKVPEKYLHLVGEHPPHPGPGLGPGRRPEPSAT